MQWATLGDTPSSFFFKTMKAKKKRGTLIELLLDNNQTISTNTKTLADFLKIVYKLFAKDTNFEPHQPFGIRCPQIHKKHSHNSENSKS